MWDLPGSGREPVSPAFGRWILHHWVTREALCFFFFFFFLLLLKLYSAKHYCFCCCLVTKSCLTLLHPPARLLSPWDFPARILEWLPFPSPSLSVFKSRIISLSRDLLNYIVFFQQTPLLIKSAKVVFCWLLAWLLYACCLILSHSFAV